MSNIDSGWFYMDNRGARQGPHDRETLLAMRRSGAVTADTSVWADGMPDWQRYGNTFARSEPPALPGVPVDFETSTRPWRRYFAKTIDLWVLGLPPSLFAVLVIAVAAPGSADGFVHALDNPIISMLLMMGTWLLAEGLLLSLLGTTPGRLLFGIRVRDASGQRLSTGSAYHRALLVLVQGMGLCVPIVTLVTKFLAHNRLTSSGNTLWDAKVGSTVKCGEIGTIRLVLSVSVFVVLYALLIAVTVADRYL
ncbi:MAG TPA: RDD family protein [Stenotrophomonas sp.]|jgi:hypothetical protein